MYGLTTGESGAVNIVLHDKSDRQACHRALDAARLNGAPAVTYERLDTPSLVEADLSEDALRGLADIALGNYGAGGYGGLRQANADGILTDISGDAEYFFYPILAQATAG